MKTQLIQFVQKNIVCRFGIPQSIVSDNGPQFISKAFQQFCTEYGIRNEYSSPRYPQSNGQVKVMNKTLLEYLKKSLTTTKGSGVDELPIALWVYRTTLRKPIRETPYALAFDAEARIPIESGLEPLCAIDSTKLAQALDELEEKRERAVIQMIEYQRRATRQVEQIVNSRAFNKGDLVLRRTFKEGKLKPIWEGPYIITDNGCKGAYRIQSPRGGVEPRRWNALYLKKYFQ